MENLNTDTKISFDKLCEIEDKVEGYKWKPEDLFFSIEDIKKHIEPDIKANLNFAIWLLQKEAITPQEKETRRYLLNLVNSIVEDEEE